MLHVNPMFDGLLIPPDCVKTDEQSRVALETNICKSSHKVMVMPGRFCVHFSVWLPEQLRCSFDAVCGGGGVYAHWLCRRCCASAESSGQI